MDWLRYEGHPGIVQDDPRIVMYRFAELNWA
jgi:hypothetical protein